MQDKTWKKNFAFRLKDGDEMISHYITSSDKSDSDTIRELLRFAINEITRKEQHTLDENYCKKQIELYFSELMRIQQEHHHELLAFLKDGVWVEGKKEQKTDNMINKYNNEKEDNKNINSSMDSSIDSVINMFNIYE